MKIAYKDESYVVGQEYNIIAPIWNCPARQRVKAVFKLEEYADGEGCADDNHYGFFFAWSERYNGRVVERQATLPDAYYLSHHDKRPIRG